MTKPRTSKTFLTNPDPGRWLAEAVVLQAVHDHFYPPQSLSEQERESACTFLQEDGRFFLRLLNISPSNIERRLGGQ